MVSNEYAAGFFDGEGTVYAAPRKNRGRASPTILVLAANTNREVLEALQARWGGSICKRPATKPRHRDQYTWTLAPRGARLFLKDVQPFLIIKAEAVREAIAISDLLALPHKERLDYTSRTPATDGAYATARVRPEFAAKLDLHWTALKELNARGFNARRDRDVNASAYGQTAP